MDYRSGYLRRSGKAAAMGRSNWHGTGSFFGSPTVTWPLKFWRALTTASVRKLPSADERPVPAKVTLTLKDLAAPPADTVTVLGGKQAKPPRANLVRPENHRGENSRPN